MIIQTPFKAYTIHPFPHMSNDILFALHQHYSLIFEELHGPAIPITSTNFLPIVRTNNLYIIIVLIIIVCHSRVIPLENYLTSRSSSLLTNHNVTGLTIICRIQESISPFVFSLLLYYYHHTTVTCGDNKPDVVLKGTYIFSSFM